MQLCVACLVAVTLGTPEVDYDVAYDLRRLYHFQIPGAIQGCSSGVATI